ncbi:hypothetical protein CC78DRAFT_107261 [Lojkania enalia]|uniref:Uncharacterized protein n=1 Tax=Lojkania enalia TaxID=147567 RepID=A0A9P4KDR3_9PLEO|nr:hypothetical protein CC78DRAFT_107261 [Didymosphaeria enalia]
MNLGHHTGGGLDLYIGLEQLLKDLDPNITDADPDGSSLQPYSRTRDSSEATSHNSKEEEGAEKDRKVDAASTLSPNPPVETWNAVNREVTQPMPNAEAGSGRSNSFTNRLGQNLLNPDPTSESSSAVHVEDSAQDALANTQHEQNGSLSFPPMWDPFLNWDASWEGHDSNAFADGINVHQLSGYLQSAYMHWPSIAAQAVGS